MLYRLACPRGEDGVSDCVFDHIVPSENCSNPGYLVEWALFIMRVVTTKSVELKLVEAHGYSMNVSNPEDSSVMGLIHSGKADISLPYMTINEERMKYVDFLNPIETNFGTFVYVNPARLKKPEMNLFKLYPNYILALAVYLGLLWLGLKVLFFHAKKNEWWEPFKIRCRVGYTIVLFYAILLSMLRSHLIIIFNSPRGYELPFRKAGDLLNRLETKEYTAVVSSQIYIDTLLNPPKRDEVQGLFDRYRRAAQINPPILEQNDKVRIGLLKNSEERYVAIGEKSIVRELDARCNHFTTFVDSSINFGYTTIMTNPKRTNLKTLRLTTAHRQVILEELRKLVLKTGKENASCENEEGSHEEHQPLTIHQVYGAFWTLLIIYIVAGICLFLELLWKLLCRGGTVKRKEEIRVVPTTFRVNAFDNRALRVRHCKSCTCHN